MIRVCSQQGAVFIYRYFPISKVSIFWYMFLVTTKNTLNSINRTKSKETDFDLHKIGFFDIGRDDRIRTHKSYFWTNGFIMAFLLCSPYTSRFSVFNLYNYCLKSVLKTKKKNTYATRNATRKFTWFPRSGSDRRGGFFKVTKYVTFWGKVVKDMNFF